MRSRATPVTASIETWPGRGLPMPGSPALAARAAASNAYGFDLVPGCLAGGYRGRLSAVRVRQNSRGIMSASRETASLGKPWSGRESRSRACCEATLSMTTHTEFSFSSCCSPDVLRLNHFASLVFGPSASAARS